MLHKVCLIKYRHRLVEATRNQGVIINVIISCHRVDNDRRLNVPKLQVKWCSLVDREQMNHFTLSNYFNDFVVADFLLPVVVDAYIVASFKFYSFISDSDQATPTFDDLLNQVWNRSVSTISTPFQFGKDYLLFHLSK